MENKSLTKALVFTLSAIFCQALMAQDVIENADYNLAIEYYNNGTVDHGMGMYESATRHFKNAHQLNPNNSDYPYALASSFYELHVYDSAKKYIERAITLERNQPDYHYRAGNIYFHAKDYQKAVLNYTITLEHLSEDYPIDTLNCHYNKAVSEFYLKQYAAAIQDLNVVLQKDPKDQNSMHLRAVSHLKLRKQPEACRDFKQARALGNPNSEQYIRKYCN